MPIPWEAVNHVAIVNITLHHIPVNSKHTAGPQLPLFTQVTPETPRLKKNLVRNSGESQFMAKPNYAVKTNLWLKFDQNSVKPILKQAGRRLVRSLLTICDIGFSLHP